MKTISPLVLPSEGNGAEWICWQQAEPLLSLTALTASCEHEDTEGEELAQLSPTDTVIHRPQYHAVLERFSQAKQRSGQFSSWAT